MIRAVFVQRTRTGLRVLRVVLALALLSMPVSVLVLRATTSLSYDARMLVGTLILFAGYPLAAGAAYLVSRRIGLVCPHCNEVLLSPPGPPSLVGDSCAHCGGLVIEDAAGSEAPSPLLARREFEENVSLSEDRKGVALLCLIGGLGITTLLFLALGRRADVIAGGLIIDIGMILAYSVYVRRQVVRLGLTCRSCAIVLVGFLGLNRAKRADLAAQGICPACGARVIRSDPERGVFRGTPAA